MIRAPSALDVMLKKQSAQELSSKPNPAQELSKQIAEDKSRPFNQPTYYLYRHYDKDGVLLYIGLTTAFRERHGNHKASKPWYGDVAKITVTELLGRSHAMETERIAIFTENPLHNKRRSKPKTMKVDA